MAEQFPPETTCWSPLVEQIELDRHGEGVCGAPGLAELLSDEEVRAGVAASMLALARKHGRLQDHRHLRRAGGGTAPFALTLRSLSNGFVLELSPVGAQEAAHACLAADGEVSTLLRGTLRHDVYAPLSTAASALEMLEEDLCHADRSASDLASTIREALLVVASRSLSLGTTVPAASASAACWVDSRVLVDAILTALAPGFAERRVTVTRGVFPTVLAEPTALWNQLSEALRALRFAGRPGAHLHLEATWTGLSFSVAHRVVGPSETCGESWEPRAEQAG